MNVPDSHQARTQLLHWCGWMFAINTVLSVAIATRYATHAQADYVAWSGLLRLPMLVAHFGLLNAAALFPAVLCVAFRRSRLVVQLVAISMCTLTLAIILVDTEIYRLYRFHLNFGVMNLIFGGAASETFIFPRAMYYTAGAVLFGISTLVGAIGFIVFRAGPKLHATGYGRPLAGVFVILLCSYHIVHAWADSVGYEPIIEQTELLPLAHGLTSRRLLRNLGIREIHGADLRAGGDTDDNLRYPRNPIGCKKPVHLPHFVFVVIDSWRFDALNSRVTPNIETFSKRGARFENHFSGGNATRIGMFSLFYSIPGTYWHRMLKEQEPPVFVRQLSEFGYDVKVFRSAPLHSPEFDRTIFAGIQELRMRSDGTRPSEWDTDLTKDFLQYLSEQDENVPSFSLLFYDAPHSFDFPDDFPTPFHPSIAEVNYFSVGQDTDPVPFRNRYLNSVNFVDKLTGEVLSAIEQRNLLRNTVVVITSDHGQEFNENGLNYWGHNSNYSRHQTQVPFILVEPVQEPRTYSYKTSHFDVLPTLMKKYLGCDGRFEDFSVGRNLFEDGGREILVMSGYDNFAIAETERIISVESMRYKVHDSNYKHLRGSSVPWNSVRFAFEQMSRFYIGTGNL